jgi:hypothetical protein
MVIGKVASHVCKPSLRKIIKLIIRKEREGRQVWKQTETSNEIFAIKKKS